MKEAITTILVGAQAGKLQHLTFFMVKQRQILHIQMPQQNNVIPTDGREDTALSKDAKSFL